jgi:Overcoming lysogenization defect protein-like, TOPRIM domain
VDGQARSRLSSAACAAGGTNAAQVAAAAAAREAAAGWDAVVLVEGISDRAALETLAARRGRDLGNEGVGIVAMGGATNLGYFLDLLGPRGRDVRLAGLCDAAAERGFLRGLQRAGLGTVTGRSGLERAGFFVCVADLEDELIRSLGAASVEQLVTDQGELASFRRFQKQPAQRGRTRQAQLRRFMGTRSGRKAQYARLLTGALDPTRVPRPLDRVLSYVN